MAYSYTFTLVSNSQTVPTPTLVNGWSALFYPLTATSFDSLNIQLDKYGSWYTVINGKNGSTGRFYDLTGQFNNYGAFPVSYSVDFDRRPGPAVDNNYGLLHYGEQKNSTLIFGNTAGFLTGNYPSSFTTTETLFPSPWEVFIESGTQAYAKSDPTFAIPYGIYNCPGTWNVRSNRSVCSIAATYSYSYNNVGTMTLAGTKTQSLQEYTNSGYCALNDGLGGVAVFSDVNGVIGVTQISQGTDSAAIAYVNAQYGSILPSGVYGYMLINVHQTYEDHLVITSANDGIFDWATLPQEVEERTTWSGLDVSSSMSTQAIYYISATQV